MKPKSYQLGFEKLKETYNTNEFKTGLTATEAKKRLQENGPNKLESQKTPKWKMFIRQFNNMVIYVLIASTIITLLMGHYSDSIIIGLVIVINAIIGYYQEANASDALEKIKQMLSIEATVYRDGKRKDVPAEELVVGDTVFLEAGDNVPADLRIIDSDNLRIQESALTGEANSVEKIADKLTDENIPLAEQTNMAFASTAVTNGSGSGLVIATASDTEIGKISTEVSSVKQRKTPLMQIIDGLGTKVSYFIVAASILIFIVGLIFDTYALPVLALAVVAMMVGAIPEGMPATTSVILAKGVSDMAKKQHTIVKTLPAVETLGSVDVVATDKTGTLTKNEMTVTDILVDDLELQVSGTGYEPSGEITDHGQPVKMTSKLKLLLQGGYYANDTELHHENNQWIISGEPTDGAFLTLYHKVFPYGQADSFEEVDILPFDSDYRYIAKLVKNEQDERILFVKGAPDKLLDMARLQDKNFDYDYWLNKVEAFSKEGKRVIAVGYEKEPDNTDTVTQEMIVDGLNFLGLVAIIDPPREEVIESLKVMRSAGVEVKMITGDNAITAKSIGKKLGLADEINAITGTQWDSLSDDEKIVAANKNQVFARTTPSNKLEIIDALQKDNKVTAMTGDGVNDAPALKKADIGVAMGIKGTDVAKDSADMILTDDNFATMSSAIKEGRRIFDNIKKSILYLLPISFSEGLIVAYAILTRQEIPLQPTQLLWINMVSAITIQFALIFEPAEEGIMDRPPRKTGSRLMNRHDVFQMTYVAILIAAVSLVIDTYLNNLGVGEVISSTTMVNTLIIGKIFYLFNIRTPKLALSKELFSNSKVFIFVGLMLLLQLFLTYVPFMQDIFSTGAISLSEWGLAIAAGAIVLVVTEIDKLIRIKLQK
ncbi:HAD-IC family P-type ATPase [Companilactobacillus alimentarius]|uniref:Magnesium-transporting ATPase n=1 Tax=Companilactobacillus alimentarius DSM 20249 TaxID=1423720 RepID=A0A2K9HL70_9LACO|nr:HAD-IC family P-type ATPase [Companilactobacillus alimentarius]AUI72657.1 magnesium-transporting ATPase [Companilactobacillus alimentarius DSM 20249]KRK75654.1 cation transport ATPase [Companilactobacillus alimentarius DSM 20249]GEO45419.1 magnesium-transporting ATPase [Companilactobacillus alimentarius]